MTVPTTHNGSTGTSPPVLCGCGCGQPVPIAKKTDRSRGWVKGQPKRFVHGHSPHLAKHYAAQRARTHCKRGHEYTEANTRIDTDGSRVCRACMVMHAQRREARKRGAYIEDVTTDMLAEELGGWIYAECAWCGVRLTRETAQVDHVHPLGLQWVIITVDDNLDLFGGRVIVPFGLHKRTSCVLACGPCNVSKSNKLLTELSPEWWDARR